MSLRQGDVINSDKITRNFFGNINRVSWKSFAWVRRTLKSALIDVPWASLHYPPQFGSVYLHTSCCRVLQEFACYRKVILCEFLVFGPASRILGDERVESQQKSSKLFESALQ